MITKEEYLSELKRIEALPDMERAQAQSKLIDAANRQLFPNWEEEKARYVKITDLPVLGSELPYGELCRQQHVDWRTGEQIPE